MHYSTAASMAVLAFAAGSQAAAAPQPYRLAVMPVLGKSLMARDTNGYQPEESHCGKGADCASACGGGYTQCGSHDDTVHCFNPAANQVCCPDNSGNSCEAGYYCTSDHQKQTWCCPNDMDLAACAAAYTVKGGLVLATPSQASTTSTTSQAPTTTSTPSTTAEPTTSTSFHSTTAWNTTTVVDEETTTVCPTTSAGTTSAWYGGNSTVISATLNAPSNTVVVPPTSVVPVVKPTSAATMSSVSGLLLALAGFVALL